MDWSSVLYSAIGGGTGALAGTFIAFAINKFFIKNTKHHRTVISAFSAGLAVIGYNVSSGMYKNMTLPRINSTLETQTLEASPLYPAIKKYEPEYFEKILTQIDSMTRKNDIPFEEMVNQSRSILVELLVDKLKYAGTSDLTQVIEISRLSYLDYKETKPQLCVLLLNGRPLGDAASYLTKKTAKSEENYMHNIIKQPRDNIIKANKEQAELSQAAMIKDMQSYLKEDDIADPPEDADIETHKRVCDIGAKSMELILELPEVERANYIRHTVVKY